MHNRLLLQDPAHSSGAIFLVPGHIGIDHQGKVRFVGFSQAHLEHRVLVKVTVLQSPPAPVGGSGTNEHAHAHTQAREEVVTDFRRVDSLMMCTAAKGGLGSSLKTRGGCYELKALEGWCTALQRDNPQVKQQLVTREVACIWWKEILGRVQCRQAGWTTNTNIIDSELLATARPKH